MKKILCLFYFIITWLLTVTAAQPHLIRKIDLNDGLSHLSGTCITQDSTGFIWAGTFSGLNRYDGYSMTIYKPETDNFFSIGGSVIFDLLPDGNNLWIATDGGGISRYEKDSGHFTVFRQDELSERSLPTNKIFTIARSGDQQIWLGTADKGLILWNHSTQDFTPVPLPGSHREEPTVIRSLLPDTDRGLWIGTQNKGLFYRHNSGITEKIYFPESGNGRTPVRSLYRDIYDRVWIGTGKHGLYFIDTEKRIQEVPGFRSYTIRALCADESNNLWVGTEENGLFFYNFQKQTIVQSETDISRVRSLFRDSEGLMWAGSRGQGIYLFNPGGSYFPEVRLHRDNTPLSVREIRDMTETEDSHLWVATDGYGLYHFDRSLNLVEHLDFVKNVYALGSQGPVMWIGTDGSGLHALNRETGERKSYELPPVENRSPGSRVVWSLLISSDHTVWAGSEGGGLYRFNPDKEAFELFASTLDPGDQKLGGMSVRCLTEDSRGFIWAGTWDGGLSRIDTSNHTIRTYRPLAGSRHSLSESSINAVMEDSRDRLWIGTAGGGINLLDRENHSFTAYTRKNGLAGDIIYGMLEDEAGKLWLSTEGGLCRIDTDQMNYSNYNKADGLPVNNFARNAYMKNSDGKLLFGSSEGILSVNTAAAAWNTFYPQLSFTSIHRYGYKINEFGYTEESPLGIHYSSNYLSLTFSALDFASPEKNIYAYRLISAKDSPVPWNFLGNKNSLTFASLPFGQHTLEIRGSNHNGIWSPYILKLPLNITPPYWKTLWFFVLCLMLLLLVILIIFRIRTRQLHNKNSMLTDFSIHMQDIREKDKKEIARDIHDELGQKLSALRMDVYHLQMQESSNQKIDRIERYNSMIELLDESLAWSKDITTSLRPLILENMSLSEALEWHVQLFEKHSNIPCELDLPDYNPELPEEYTIALFRIAQEMLTNVARHSGARSVYMNLEIDAGSVILCCQDDGSGFNKTRQKCRKSFGLIGMKERTERMGGRFSIRSRVNEGTRVIVTIPLGGTQNA